MCKTPDACYLGSPFLLLLNLLVLCSLAFCYQLKALQGKDSSGTSDSYYPKHNIYICCQDDD